jgi:nucleoid DNA-binding protein
MALPLIEQLARHLNVNRQQASEALFGFVEQLKADINVRKRAEIRGVGTLHVTNESIQFRPDAGLSMLVNNRFAALETETVQVAPPRPPADLNRDAPSEFEDADPIPNDFDTDDTLMGDSLDSAFWEGIPDDNREHPLGKASEPPFEEADFSILFPSANSSNDITNSPESAQSSENGATSMKEDDPKKPLFSNQDGSQPEDEWSPFFEELEGVEFEVDSPLDLDDTVWDEAKPPQPPASPFANDRTDEEDEFFFESDRENELFGASFDDDMPEDAPWASSSTEDAPFFEDKPGKRGARPSPLDEYDADDELFSTSDSPSGRGNSDSLFSEDELYSKANVSEADETIFLPPDARSTDSKSRSPRPMDRKVGEAAATVAGGTAAAAARSDRRPYDRRRSNSGGSGMLWAGLIGLAVILAGASYAYMQGMLPFGPGASPPEQNPSLASSTPDPAPTETPSATDPGTVPSGDPAGTPTAGVANPTPAGQAPPVQPTTSAAPREFVSGRGGWTIVVSSRESVSEAEALQNRYAQVFASQNFPVDILRTDDFGTPRYRVGVGQFSSTQAATAAMAQHAASLPSDAWVTTIPR